MIEAIRLTLVLLLLLHTTKLTIFHVESVSINRPDDAEDDMTPRIFHGEDADVDDFPSYVGLLLQNCSQFSFCGAFLVCKNVLVTAAHCCAFEHFYAFPYLQKTNYFHYSGETRSFATTGQFKSRAVPVKQVIKHPKYNSTFIQYDVAVVVLDCAVDESQYTKYSSYCACGEPDVGQYFDVGGFGKTNVRKPLPMRLQKLAMRKISNADCAESSDDYRDGNVRMRRDLFCMVDGDNSMGSVCNGDSGSGVYHTCRGSKTAAGIISLGIDECDTGLPSGFGNICNPEIKDFIDQYVDEHCQSTAKSCKLSNVVNPCPLRS